MQVLFLGRAPRTKETLPDFLKWRRVTRPPLVFRGLTGSQRTPGFWGVTIALFVKRVKKRQITFSFIVQRQGSYEICFFPYLVSLGLCPL